MKRRPRKFLRTLFVFLFLGAIVNVAVAWLAIAVERFPVRYGNAEVSSGFPIASLGGELADDAVLAVPIGGWMRYFPLRPLWPGFALNTIFYAAILWVLWITPGNVRRAIRRRRGRCPACGYPVGSSEVCTECGNPLEIRTGMGLPPPATPAS